MEASTQNYLKRRNCLEILHGNTQKEIEVENISRKISMRNNHSQLRRRITCDKDTRETGLNPFSLFPKEIWTMIFSYLTETADLLNCMNTCSQFQNMLEEKRTTFLFGQVVPFLVGELPFKDILETRLVSRKWCSDIDKLLEGVNFPTLAENLPDLPRSQRIKFFARAWPNTFDIPLEEFIDIAEYERRRNAMKSHPRNPLLGRRVKITAIICYSEERASIEYQAKAILADFSQHLFHVEIYIDIMPFHPRQHFTLICHALTVCKNLKTLKICNSFPIYQFSAWTHNEFNFSEEDIPCCSQLESLHLFETRRETIQDALLRKYCNQLKCLEVCHWHQDIFQRLSWPNLRCLSVGPNFYLEGPMTMEAPRLEELGISLNDFRTVEFRQMLCFINCFPVLTTCTLKFPGGREDDEFLKTEHISDLVCSRRVTCLNLVLMGYRDYALSLDFLLFFPSLERLNITIYEWYAEGPVSSIVKDRRGDDFIQLAHCLNEQSLNGADTSSVKPMYKSNIWQVLTRLKFFKIVRNKNNAQYVKMKIANVVYTRSAYKASLFRA